MRAYNMQHPTILNGILNSGQQKNEVDQQKNECQIVDPKTPLEKIFFFVLICCRKKRTDVTSLDLPSHCIRNSLAKSSSGYTHLGL